MKVKRFNESIRDKMTPKDLDVEKIVDSCFLKDSPDEYFTRDWKKDEVISEETDNYKIMANFNNFLYKNLDGGYRGATDLSLAVFDKIDKEALKEAMLKILEEELQKKK